MADQPPSSRGCLPWIRSAAAAIVADCSLSPALLPRFVAIIAASYRTRGEKSMHLAERRELDALMKFFAVVPAADAKGAAITHPYRTQRILDVRAMINALRDWQRMPAKVCIVALPGECYEIWRV